jgi:hypothetical protein
LQAVYDGLDATKRKNAWGLSLDIINPSSLLDGVAWK